MQQSTIIVEVENKLKHLDKINTDRKEEFEKICI